MIMFERFEAAKIRRFISRYGKSYDIKTPYLNVFKEPTGLFSALCTIKGVYHEASYKYFVGTDSNAGAYVQEIEPLILCLKTESSDLIKIGDRVEVNGKVMEVQKVKDLNNSGFAYDISLRYVDNGGKA